MISEPELVGGAEFPAALEPLPVEPKRPGPRRPWLWALGGAVAASAVWAGGLVAYDRGESGAGPDLRGYRAEEDPCRKARLPGLSSAFGGKGETTNPLVLDHPALFRAECVVTLDAKPVPYQLNVSYTLHRATDPRPEFEARMNDPFQGIGDRVSGVGEIGYLKDNNDGGEMELHVLDGQAVVQLGLSPVLTYDGEGPQPEPPRLDPAATRTYLVEDMNELLAALRT
ncbi:hypothetical protein [Streptomyces showdoensis]|uniref:DUF3558 domain-containing protein n=1 Tax=Streptomyces showdoensis TaxID=68268 RepID=A0A2P2GL59_STREW|nr:hypothetical protein [Streptomyces showdoensis]KKZ71545.1 hypothetical protein VO63_22885 [Streptomyces showdoensis]